MNYHNLDEFSEEIEALETFFTEFAARDAYLAGTMTERSIASPSTPPSIDSPFWHQNG